MARPRRTPAATRAALDDTISAWERSNRRRGLAERTSQAYSRVVADFLLWVERSDQPPILLKDVDVRHVEAFLAAKLATEASKNHAVVALRSFFTYAAKNKVVDVEPDLPRTRRLKHATETVSRQSFDRLRAAIRRTSSHLRRDIAIFEILRSTGIRTNELVALDVEDFDGNSGVLNVRGHADRALPLDPPAVEALQLHLSDIEAHSGALFPGVRAPRLNVRYVTRMLNDAAVRADVALTPRLLRHTKAAALADAGVSIGSLQKHLGHASKTSTFRYFPPGESRATPARPAIILDSVELKRVADAFYVTLTAFERAVWDARLTSQRPCRREEIAREYRRKASSVAVAERTLALRFFELLATRGFQVG